MTAKDIDEVLKALGKVRIRRRFVPQWLLDTLTVEVDLSEGYPPMPRKPCAAPPRPPASMDPGYPPKAIDRFMADLRENRNGALDELVRLIK